MSTPIKTSNSAKIDGAPTPYNTPASVLKDSFLKNGNPTNTISEEPSNTFQTINEESPGNVLANNPQLLASIQDKLGSLVGQDSGYISSLPKLVKDRIYALKKLQRDLFQLEKDFQLEMFQLEQKYLSKYQPLHQHRFALINGEKEPTLDEINQGKEEIDDLDDDIEEDHQEGVIDVNSIKGIPSFWLTALENLPMVSQTITDRDAEVLDFLSDIKMEYLTEGRPGFKLIFRFGLDNPFFKNEELVKVYYYQSELGYSGDFIYDHAEGCNINWVDHESNVTVSIEKRKQRNKTTKQVRTIEKITPVESFFNFFDPPRVPSQEKEAEEENEQDEQELAELEERLALDYAIGEEIKDKLIPRAVDWFTGAAMEFEYENADEDSEDEEGYEDEDSEEDDFSNSSIKKEQPPECNQS